MADPTGRGDEGPDAILAYHEATKHSPARRLAAQPVEVRVHERGGAEKS